MPHNVECSYINMSNFRANIIGFSRWITATIQIFERFLFKQLQAFWVVACRRIEVDTSSDIGPLLTCYLVEFAFLSSQFNLYPAWYAASDMFLHLFNHAASSDFVWSLGYFHSSHESRQIWSAETSRDNVFWQHKSLYFLPPKVVVLVCCMLISLSCLSCFEKIVGLISHGKMQLSFTVWWLCHWIVNSAPYEGKKTWQWSIFTIVSEASSCNWETCVWRRWTGFQLFIGCWSGGREWRLRKTGEIEPHLVL